MKIEIPQIPVQKGGVKMFDADFLMHLRPSPYYGSLNMKFYDYHQRHIYMNALLKEIYELHALQKPLSEGKTAHTLEVSHFHTLFVTETFIYWIRKNTDEIIGLLYFFHHFQTENTEPQRLQISSIGALLNEKNHALNHKLKDHLLQLDIINEISNTYKHSFIMSEVHNLIGKDEPTVNCLDMKRNSILQPPVYHSYFLRQIIEYYVLFFIDAREMLKNEKKETNDSE